MVDDPEVKLTKSGWVSSKRGSEDYHPDGEGNWPSISGVPGGTDTYRLGLPARRPALLAEERGPTENT